jgi:hypothetical protein
LHRPRLLLHCCCAPCGTHPYRALSESHDVSVHFDNPNIQPESEYRARLEEMRGLAGRWGFALVEAPYEPEAWRAAVRGLEDEPEGGARCAACIRFRLGRTAAEAKRLRMEAFAASLSVSPHKNAALINRIGREEGERAGVRFVETDFKKKEGFRISCELSREEGLYRQDYCGCEFSRRESDRRREARALRDGPG